MKAIVYTEYGTPDVFQLCEVDKPNFGPKEVLIKVRATTVNAGDINARDFSHVPKGLTFLARLMFGITKPRKPIIGTVFSGEVVEVGGEVNAFSVGDNVFGIDGNGMGAYAEYKAMPEKGALAVMPSNATFEEAASVPFGASTSMYFLQEKAKIKSGQQVLINGASGDVGTAAVQLAKSFGAEVTGVCSTSRMEIVKDLGADHVIDYTAEDFTKNDKVYDIVLDMVCNKPFAEVKGVLKKGGFYLAVAGGLREMWQMLTTGLFGSKRVIFGGGESCEKKEYQIHLKKLIESGNYKPVIDRTFPLEMITDAHKYYDKGHRLGNVVISVGT